jgi:thiamine-monophosphate kinase
VGHRALARSLSDIAAMGGTPRYALVSLALSRGTTRAWVEDFYRGLAALAGRFGVALVGGDTAVVAGRTMIDVIVVGEVSRGKALRRSGARPGDRIYVSGQLGLSALGLRLRKDRRGAVRRALAEPIVKAALEAHLFPEPQCALGRLLSSRRLATAMMDISDGLSIDLARLCEASRVGACLVEGRIPGPGLEDRQKSLELALHGGEDYQLLFTVPPRKETRIPSWFRGLPLHRIGEIQARPGMRLMGTDGTVRALKPAGWDYFRSERRPRP